ncbi:uncharacterized protein DUF4439 [Haloactinospora alba]|uniref:Uncharacterized protein DUF4439 n=1 Tax=Haloactinospora alba TaxID=405555 RepID=A0A543NKV8_9ACTN|nr:ferritin-like domain-containing protein [Haloactinospora alba]TQN32451.1 uncharacterized protein DUF4439 [Haloactinospora alba]
MRPTATGDIAADDALQAALAAEHAAVYGYGYIGAHSTEGQRERSRRCLDEHRRQRDVLREKLRQRDVTPTEAEDAYQLPDDTGEDALASFARELEGTAAQNYLQLASVDEPQLRELAAHALQSTTVRGLPWGAELPTFPGFPDGEPPGPDSAGE